MLGGIVNDRDATAPGAKLLEFTAGGKTGTAQKYNTETRGYTDRIPSFLGFFPAEHPRFVVYIALDSVGVRPAWGGKLAAPVFQKVSTSLGRYLKSTGRLSLYSSEDNGAESSGTHRQ
jgi:cell division protein FtsI/penicillin-binding protein 2